MDYAPAQALSMKPTKPTSRSCRGSRPPAPLAWHLAGRYTRTVKTTTSGPDPGTSSGRLGPEDQQHGGVRMVERTPPWRNSNKGITLFKEEEREREKLVCREGLSPPLHIGERGHPTLLNWQGGTKPQTAPRGGRPAGPPMGP